MGEVYKAFDPVLKRFVALKFIRGDDPQLVERFLQEARAQARVEHQHVVKIYEVGEVEGRHYIAMQFIEGKTLKEAAREMSLEQRVKVMKEVAEAVHAAHKLGLIHRDIKPDNILIEASGEGGWKPYVMDFGLAREQEAPGLTQTGMVIGTPDYMAPEQARGEVHGLDRRTDVWALGATLYEILVGHRPFEGATTVDVMMKILQEEPPPLRKVEARIPVDLETIVLKCLEKELSRRYETARALAEDLGRYLDGEPILARRASWTYRVVKKARKHRLDVALGSALVVVILVLGWLQWQARRREALVYEFGQEVILIGEIMKGVYMQPLHDIRGEVEQVRGRMQALEVRMRRVGRMGEGPGHYALGRAYWMLRSMRRRGCVWSGHGMLGIRRRRWPMRWAG